MDSGRHRTTTEREDKGIVTSAFSAPDSSLSTIRRVTRTRVSNITIDKPTERAKSKFAPTVKPLEASRLYTVNPHYNGAWLNQFETTLTGDV